MNERYFNLKLSGEVGPKMSFTVNVTITVESENMDGLKIVYSRPHNRRDINVKAIPRDLRFNKFINIQNQTQTQHLLIIAHN